MEEAKDKSVNDNFTFHQEKLKVSISKGKGFGNPLNLHISIALVTNNLLQRESQTTITNIL